MAENDGRDRPGGPGHPRDLSAARRAGDPNGCAGKPNGSPTCPFGPSGRGWTTEPARTMVALTLKDEYSSPTHLFRKSGAPGPRHNGTRTQRTNPSPYSGTGRTKCSPRLREMFAVPAEVTDGHQHRKDRRVVSPTRQLVRPCEPKLEGELERLTGWVEKLRAADEVPSAPGHHTRTRSRRAEEDTRRNRTAAAGTSSRGSYLARSAAVVGYLLKR